MAVQNQIVKDPKTGAESVIPVTTGNSGSGLLRVVSDVPVSKVTPDRGTNPIGNCDQTGVFSDVSGYLNWVNSAAQAMQ